MFDDFNIFDSPGDAGGSGGLPESLGCMWNIIAFCIFAILIIVFVQWMS